MMVFTRKVTQCLSFLLDKFDNEIGGDPLIEGV